MTKSKYIFLSILIFLGVECVFAYQESQSELVKDNSSIVRKIADINMRTFDWRGESWSFNKFVDFIKFISERIINLPVRNKRKCAFNLFESEENGSGEDYVATNSIDNSSTWKDLDLYCGKSDVNKFVANVLDRTVTEIGRVSFYCLIAEPTCDIELLRKRQQIVHVLRSNENLCNLFEDALQNIRNAENCLLHLWSDMELFKHYLEYARFPKYLEFLNNSEDLLLLKHLFKKTDMSISFFLRILTSAALVTYGVLHLTKVINVPESVKKWVDKHHSLGIGMCGEWLTSLAWKLDNQYVHALLSISFGIYCATTLKQDIDESYGSYLLEQFIQLMMINIAKVFENIKVIYDLLRVYPEFEHFEEFEPLKDFYEKRMIESSSVQDFLELLTTTSLKKNPSIFSHYGVVLRAYYLARQLKEKFESALVAVARVDAYVSISKIVKEYEDKQHGWCFPEYNVNSKPFINISDFWHPLIDSNDESSVVINSITLGVDKQRSNVIITGPNEAGKSIALKSIALCLILAQTLGIAPASKMSFTPFSTISSYLNVTDDIGAGNSLFKEEVLIAQRLISQAQNSREGEFHFAVFDEIFNGTSPIEGSAAAYSLAKHLGKFENSMCIISTHFDLLTRLEFDTDYFSNYRVYIIRNEDGSIFYPYKLEKGISDQHVVFDILQREGFSSDLIDDAQKMVLRNICFT